MSLLLNTDLALINTITNAGTITLPLSTTIPGRVITFKDITATFGQKTLTLNTTNPDTFEDGATTKILKESGGIIQIVGTSNKWYILAGTQQNTLNISSLLATSISTTTISSINASVSTINFQNNLGSTLSMYQVSSLLYFNSNVFAGSKVLPGTVLNRYRFSLLGIPNLVGWYDGKDPLGNGVAPANGTSISSWNDKSGYNNNATQVTPGNQPTYNSSGYLSFNGTTNFLNFNNPGLAVSNTLFSIFIVEQRQSANASQFLLRGPSSQLNSMLHIGYYIYPNSFVFAFYANDLGYINATDIPAYVPGNEPFRIWSFIYGSAGRRMYLNGKLLTSDTNNVNLISWNNGNIGGGFTGTFYTGNINEILFYKPFIDGYQRQQVEGYLAWKWGLQASLPASHPFYNAPPQ